jgi:GH24 family phage-related lysozyme (muramidase)
MAFHDINLLAATLSPQEFELLLRAYVAKQLNDNNTKADFVSFFYSCRHSETQRWTVSRYTNGDDTKTTGEVLAMCTVEAARREVADKANTLLLLEHTE